MPNPIKAIAAGLLATVALTSFLYGVLPVFTGVPLDIAGLIAWRLGGTWAGGMLFHFMLGGVLFPLVYAGFVHLHLPGGTRLRGVLWGLALWVIAQTIVLPIFGGGFFSLALGGAPAALGSLLGHLAYGLVFGILIGAHVSAGAGLPQPAPAGPRRRG